ncbi:MAG: 2'-5' RNA ligase family protein [Bacteroidales bacterium]
MEKQLYFIGVIPGEDMEQRIKKLKIEMHERFESRHALKSPAHITLQMPFRADPADEIFIMDALKEFSASQRSFDVNLSGFGCFKPRVIFIRISNPEPLQELHLQMKPVLKNKINLTERQIGNRFHPHITIATRDLSEKKFYEAWNEFHNRKFEGKFTINYLVLFKHNGKFWDIYREIPVDLI